MQKPSLGLHCLLNSLSTQSIFTKAMPSDGFNVVNGLGLISTSARVDALKKVDFPDEGFPHKAINIKLIY